MANRNSSLALNLKRTFSRRQIEIPHAAEIPASAKRGFLWRLGGRKLMKNAWKRKFFLLYDDKLFYYNSETGIGAEPGSGVIDLQIFMDCVEAPVTDHKKATNVFILLARERGIFDQGRYYLSADTLSDMKDWIVRIKSFIGKREMATHQKKNSESQNSAWKETLNLDNTYASIREASIQRSNSMSTIPSQHNDFRSLHYDWFNRSMDLGPVCPLATEESNLTYSYSSDDDSLSESFTVNIVQKPDFLHTREQRTLSKQQNNIQSYSYRNEHIKDFGSRKRSLKNGESSSGESTLTRSLQRRNSKTNQLTIHNLSKMEQILKKATKQSEELNQMFRKFEFDSQAKSVESSKETLDTGLDEAISNFGKSVDVMQSSLKAVERKSRKLLQEIELANEQVTKSLAEARRERKDFEKIKNQIEHVLQNHKQMKNVETQRPRKTAPELSYECHTFPKSRQHKENRHSIAVSSLVSELEDEDWENDAIMTSSLTKSNA